MVNALNRTKVRGVVDFSFFSWLHIDVTSIFSTKMGILNGFVCNMFFVNIEIKVFSVVERIQIWGYSVDLWSYVFELLFVES